MASPRLYRWERVGLAAILVLALAFGVLIELRSCYQNTRKTDFEVYLRAAWAVRTGADIYSVTCSNGYHYTYPPAFAIVMTPFADAPKGAPRDGLLPYPLVVALWTAFNYLLVIRMAHVLAGLALPHEVRGSRRWWYARTVPCYIAFGGIGYSIGFGQVNVLLLAMFVEMLRSNLAGKRLQSGLWLAAAIVLKVFPAYLLVLPLIRRDVRTLMGSALGLVIGLAVIPAAALGVERTEAIYRTYLQNVLLPGALGTKSTASVRELIDLPSNDSQSFLAVIHSNLYPDRSTQPGAASANTRLVHNLISAGLTLLAIAVVLRRGTPTVADAIIALGLFSLLMLHIAPMSHMHYYAFGYPLAAGLWLKGMSARRGRVFPGWAVLLPLIVWSLGTALPLLPGPTFKLLRHHGLGLASSMLLLSVGLMECGRIRRVPVELPQVLRRAA